MIFVGQNNCLSLNKMMKKFLFYFSLCIVILLTSCNNKKMMKEKPNDLIQRDSIISILADAYILESSLFFAPAEYDKQILTRQLYQELYAKHHISREQYVSSVEYYLSNEDVARELLTEVSQEVTNRVSELPPDTSTAEVNLNNY